MLIEVKVELYKRPDEYVAFYEGVVSLSDVAQQPVGHLDPKKSTITLTTRAAADGAA